MDLKNSVGALVSFLAAAYHLEWLLLHIDKILPSQICGINLR